MRTLGQEALEHQLTHHDLEYTPNDGNRYELIDGVLYVTPFPSYRHQHAATQLTILLGAFVHKHKLGHVFAAGLKVVLDEPTGVGPDLAYIAAARMDRMQDDGYHGAPDLVVEVLSFLVVEVLSSKPQLDRYIKLNKYAEAGIPHYWIVDPVNRSVSVYQLDGERYRLAHEASKDETFSPKLFPDLHIQLNELWV